MSRRGRTTLLAGACVLAALLAACSSGNPGVSDEASRPIDTERDATDDDPADTSDTPTTDPSTTEPSGDPTDPTDPTSPGTVPPPTDPVVVGELRWEPYNDDVEVGTIDVPLDYDQPDGATVELFVARHLADPDERIGSLLVNPGGPGFGGSDFAIFAAQVFDSDLVERFDIIGWDPRGTGMSEPPIDCIDDFDPYVAAIDMTPDTPEEKQLAVDTAVEFQAQCEQNNAEIMDHVGTNSSARDIDTIRRALGEDQITYFGFSYGSELGATWATLFPETVRAAVLDGAADPTATSTEMSMQQVQGFEGTLSTFLEQCSADDDCRFHNDGDAEGAFDRLMEELDENPVPSEPGRPDVNRVVALTGVNQAMYAETFWPALERALADAAAGDGAGLLALYDSYYQRASDGTYGNELEAFQVISCADSDERLSVEEEDALGPQFTAVAPRLAPEGAVGGYFCTFFDPPSDPRIDITGAGAGPIVVIGTTGDPATPLESTRRMADTLEDGRLVIVEADQHTGYGVNRCIIDLVNAYLIDLEPPEHGTECT
jgi:pimeloyl-ACP methyl ester carboxylesterase